MNMRNVWDTARRHGAPVAGLAALVLIGSLVLMAAPSAAPAHPATAGAALLTSTSPTATSGTGAQTAKRNVQTTTGTGTPAATDTPTPDPNATPSPTDTPTPQPTDAPTPSPTATPTPTWHTIGSYSGDTAGVFATFDNLGTQMRITWTCQDTPQIPTWSLIFNIEGGRGQGTACQPGQTSGVFTFYGVPTGTLTLYVDNTCPSSGCAPTGPWTATVEVWY